MTEDNKSGKSNLASLADALTHDMGMGLPDRYFLREPKKPLEQEHYDYEIPLNLSEMARSPSFKIKPEVKLSLFLQNNPDSANYLQNLMKQTIDEALGTNKEPQTINEMYAAKQKQEQKNKL